MIYFTDIYGLYSLMVVMLFECELRLVRWFSVIGRYCHDISNWDENRKILSREHYKKGTESDCYLLNLINGVQWLWGGHRRTRTVKVRTALSRPCPAGQTDRQTTDSFFPRSGQNPDSRQTPATIFQKIWTKTRKCCPLSSALWTVSPSEGLSQMWILIWMLGWGFTTCSKNETCN